MSIYTSLKSAVEKRAQYQRTKWEIENMPLYVAHDLGIFREDAAKIASRAVYG